MRSSEASAQDTRADLNRKFLIGLARAFGGAIIFSLPIFMTMEMWELGFSMDRGRLVLFLIAMLPLLVGLSHYVGYERTFGWKDDLLDTFVALAVGFLTGLAVLLLVGVLKPGQSWDVIIGNAALQGVAGSIGAMLAQNQLGGESNTDNQNCSYAGELFLAGIGALFLSFNIAPTEEIVLIAAKITSWQAAILASVSLLLTHAFVYAVEFRGQEELSPTSTGPVNEFFRYTVPAYALALLISLYVLWTFGQTDGMGLRAIVTAMIVLGFPATIGAAAARLIF